MAKASLELRNGTVVTLEGTPEEVKHLLELYGGEKGGGRTPRTRKARKPKTRTTVRTDSKDDSTGKPDLNQIVTLVKNCDEAETIEKHILDRAAQVDRTLLPLYIAYEYLDNAFGLTSGEVNKITKDLGIPISQPAASRTLSGTASNYVIGDKVKIKGQAVRYKLSRRGLQYVKGVLDRNANG